MILFSKIFNKIEEVDASNSNDELIKLIDYVLNDTNKLVVDNLQAIKKMIQSGNINKDILEVYLSNYKRYFNRDNGGTPEVVRGITMQSKIEDLLK